MALKFPRFQGQAGGRVSGGIRPVRVPRVGGGGEIGASVERLGFTLGRAADALAHVEAQRIERETAQSIDEFNLGVKQIELEHQQVGDPDEFAALFTRDIRTLAENILGRARNEAVRERLGDRLSLAIGEVETNVGFEVAKRKGLQEIAGLNKMIEELPRRVANAPSLRAREEIIDNTRKMIADMVARNIITPQAAQQAASRLDQTLRIGEVRENIRLDPEGTLTDLKSGAFELTQTEREDLINVNEAHIAGIERARKEQLAEARREENIRLYRKLRSKEDSLTLEEVLDAKFLNREDMEFFRNALRRVDDPRTDPALFVRLTDLLTTTGKNRDQQIKDATLAKSLAQQAYMVGDTLAKADASAFIEGANKVIAGEDPDKDSWFDLAEQMIRRRFGVLDPLERKLMALRRGMTDEEVGRELSEGENMYYGLITRLKQEMEDDTSLRGRKVWERAVEMTQPDAVNFWNNKASNPEPPLESRLPNPLDYEPNSVINVPSLGRSFTNGPDGKKWR